MPKRAGYVAIGERQVSEEERFYLNTFRSKIVTGNPFITSIIFFEHETQRINICLDFDARCTLRILKAGLEK